MQSHTFTSKLLVSNYNKTGIPRLRVSVHTRDYEFITYNGDVRFLTKMTVKRPSGQIVNIDSPRLSKGTSNGKYAPHYITIPQNDVKNYGFEANEPVQVTVEW